MDSLDMIRRISPEIVEIVERRYSILRAIYYDEPIGRRALSSKLNLQERLIRNEAVILKEQGLIDIDGMGMYITNEGKQLLKNLHDLYIELKGIPQLEEILKNELNISKVTIVPGDSNQEDIILKDMAKATSRIVKDVLTGDDILGVTGGNTMAAVSHEFISDNKKRNVTVIPARGGLGTDVYTQSNSIAAELAKKLGGEYRLLYVPDGLSKEAIDLMLENPDIKETLDFINDMNVLIFGIGRGDTMGRRRNLPDEKIESLLDDGVVAEAFGHYFDIKGKEVWEYKTIGLSLDKFKEMDNIIGVAGGEEKAEAIIAVSSINKNLHLITDELAARKIIEILNLITN